MFDYLGYAYDLVVNKWGHLIIWGALITIALALTTLPFGAAGGLGLALLKLSRRRWVRNIAEAYTTFFRGVPDLFALFIVYFGFQWVITSLLSLFGLDTITLDPFITGVISMSSVVAAYSSEVWVAALKSVPKGQHEAAEALGLTPVQKFVKIVFPQLIRIAVPGLGNIWMSLLKDTSLVSTLGLEELTSRSDQAGKGSGQIILFWCIAALIYLFFSTISSMAQTSLEKRVNRGYA